MAIALVLISSGVARGDVAALGDISITGDSDRFYAYRERVGGLWGYTSYLDYFGVAAQTTHYTQSNWNQDAPALIGLWRHQDRSTLAGINAEGGVVQVAGHTRVIGDATWSFRPRPSTGLELIAAGDIVETQTAIEQGVAYGFYGASVEQQLLSRLTVIGLIGYQPFTDGNERVHLRARLIWDAVPKYGITAQLRWREYESSQTSGGTTYFNPEQYRQWQAALAMRRRLPSGWMFSAALAGGQETINYDTTQPTVFAEMRTEGPFLGKCRLGFRALYSRSTAYVDSPDYWFAQIGATLIIPF